jgi:signal transduction histidine kinase/PAS domain-containing protein
MSRRSRAAPPAGVEIAPTVRGEVLAGLEIKPGDLVQDAANRLAALTARAASAATAMIHLAEGRKLRLIGGVGLPEGWRQMESVPTSSTLAGLVIHYGFAVVIRDVQDDPRVAPDAPLRLVGIRSYAGFPVRDLNGEAVGTCAVTDYRPRDWRADELAAVDEGAQACTAFVAEQRAWELAERQRLFLDTMLDSLDTGVTACDEYGRLVVVNHPLRDRLRVCPTEDPPRRWVPRLPLSHPDGHAFTVAETPLLRALSGEQVRGVETVVDRPGQPRRIYAVNAHPITGSGGQRLGAVSVFHDITVQRRAERSRCCELAVTQALNASDTVEQAAPRVLESVASALGWPYAELWLVDPKAQVLRLADRHGAPGFDGDLAAPGTLAYGQGLAGAAWRRAEPVWRTGAGLPDSAGPAEAATGNELRTALAVPVRSGGGTLAVLSLFTDVLEDPQDSIAALVSGVAVHIGQFIERRRAEDLQRALATSKNNYFNMVGHELRTPLAVISAHLELIGEEEPGTTLTEVRPMLDAIGRGAVRLTRLVDALADLSALDAGRATVHSLPVNLAAAVAEAVADVQDAADSRRLQIDVELPEWVPVIGDVNRLTQLARILLDNAVTYTPEGARITVNLGTSNLGASGGCAVLTVADTGYGIPESERPYIFQRFHRGAIATERAIPGAGLGLATAQLIAARHGADIILEPADPDRPGTTFRVRFPVGDLEH